jgi:hypothetical protein
MSPARLRRVLLGVFLIALSLTCPIVHAAGYCELCPPSDAAALDSCGDGCDDGCDDECGGLLWPYGRGRILGIVGPSDQEFLDFVSPISNPLFFEDPRTLTELKPIFVEHAFPSSNPVLQGGDAQVYAAQFRLALTERLSLIAAKDGWIDISTPTLGHRDGFADTAIGFKYNFFKNPATQTLASAGFTYEWTTGQSEVFQGQGDGEFHFFASGGKRLLPNWFLLSGAGFRIPVDHRFGSQMFYWSNSLAWRFVEGRCPGTGLYLLGEINWFHWLRSGENLPFDFEGGDLINFGSTNVAGNDVVTGLLGPKWKPTPFQEIGAGVEIPLTARKDVYDHRVYAQWIFRY